MLRITLFTITIITGISLFAQNDLEKLELYHNVLESKDVVVNGEVTRYNKYVGLIGGGAIRNDEKGYASQGYVEDYYSNKQLLHKGYYVDGQLTNFENYFENGKIERIYRLVSGNESTLTTFFESGAIKSFLVFEGKKVRNFEAYYSNGQRKEVTEFDTSFKYFKRKADYYANGNIREQLRLVKKKKNQYMHIEYYKNGQIRVVGNIAVTDNMEVRRFGKWKEFNDNGKPINEWIYEEGKLLREHRI